jgi:hypothetical protein
MQTYKAIARGFDNVSQESKDDGVFMTELANIKILQDARNQRISYVDTLPLNNISQQFSFDNQY